MISRKIQLLILLISFSFFSLAQKKEETKSSFEYKGRIEKLQDHKAILVGSASSISFDFTGNSCSVSLQSLADHQNYVSFELDGKYIGRIRIGKGEIKSYPIVVSEKKKHIISPFIKPPKQLMAEFFICRNNGKNNKKEQLQKPRKN